MNSIFKILKKKNDEKRIESDKLEKDENLDTKKK